MKYCSLFWRFTTPENDNSSIIYGTIHLSTPESLTYWKYVQDFLDDYDTVYTESSLDESSAKQLQMHTLLKQPLQYSDFISQRRWEKMRKAAIKYCSTELNHLKPLHPLFIIAQLQFALLKDGVGIPLDQMIWNYAASHGKVTSGIETSSEQIDILNQMDISGLYHQLNRMLKNVSKTRKALTKIQQLYVHQDIHGLYKKSKQSLGRDKGLLISKRNHTMASRLLSIHNRRASFFSFGAGHLAGGEGVLRILKKKGALLESIKV